MINNFSLLEMEILFQIAQRGDVENLNQFLAKNPYILHHVPLITTIQNPLHVACRAGHLDFSKTILQLNPELASQLDADGYSPMHLATAYGHMEIVKEFIQVDSNICRLAGREGRTPLHLAVLSGRVDLIDVILANCEGCLEDVTVQKETVFHLAVKNFQFRSLQVLLNWARDMSKEEILNRKDEHGNTILHIAIWKKQRQVVDMLLTNTSWTLEVNATNKSGLTALDLLLIFPSEAGDREIQEILQRAGALKAQDIALNNISPSRTNDSQQQKKKDLIEYFRFHEGRDSPSDVRSTLLVIAVLVATATYQVGTNPPGGLWQDDSEGHLPGTSVLGTLDIVSYILLVACNSIGFNVSLYMISTLTKKFPLRFEFQICLVALYVTFNVAVANTAPRSARVFAYVLTSILPSAVPISCSLLREYKLFERIGIRGLFHSLRGTS